MTEEIRFTQAQKHIKNVDDVDFYSHTKAYRDLMYFAFRVNRAIKSKKLSDPVGEHNPLLDTLVTVLDELQNETQNHRPAKEPSRFGFPQYRTWNTWMCENSPQFIARILPTVSEELRVDIQPHFEDSFGNQTRIDYGTGHEAAFLCFLTAISLLVPLTDEDYAFIGLRAFPRYLTLVRFFQRSYRMEPAGTHGVWGLDDYQFFPFLWGSSQLIGSDITTESVMNINLVNKFKADYLYHDAISYIYTVKSGPFYEHSPVLYSVSGVGRWEKVNTGMFKMYRNEVLNKFPIVQHFFFGKVIQFIPLEIPDANDVDPLEREFIRLFLSTAVPAQQQPASTRTHVGLGIPSSSMTTYTFSPYAMSPATSPVPSGPAVMPRNSEGSPATQTNAPHTTE
ncbi:putative Serine/threonine-protein phosphatase 2A activator [Blattamonas nauphoetae]|uniref:Serine/threonine-protein phosphatase 2A activator n=1 Tax=Blattamonas nauphoetae TaxID=2049346 RepID=A0ABQ9XXE0_9EUKA|nr:putative Serine/threonine-protein phosphatase 2A activator [Blattamonas nauphoetae]